MNEPNKKEQQIKKIIIEVINKKGGSLKREDIYNDIEQQVNASKLTETYKSIESYRSTVRSCISKLKEEGYLQQFNFLEITLKGRELLSASAFKLETEPSFQKIYQDIRSKGLRIAERTLRRYHLALKTRKFVILSGISGTGKTWLTKAYADAVEAEYLPVPVAPNWTTNEDLLGYLNPITDEEYHYTDFSRFLEEAEKEYKKAQEEKRTPKPYHLVLDEMNLARVEYYFAKFLSAMEVRMREGEAKIELAPDKQVSLAPNLYFIGTVNMDETTQGFAEKVYDRAQLIELEVFRKDLDEHLGKAPYREILMNIWDSVHAVAPFAFRVLDEIKTYVEEAEKLKEAESYQKLDDVWREALDEQLLQKILPKLKGADERVGEALKAFVEIAENEGFELSREKAAAMLETFNKHGFTSYF